MKIVDKNKFIKMITVIIGIITLIIFFFSGSSFSKGEIKTKTFCVSSGDTLWSIASYEQENNDYYKDKDVRQIICELRKLNNIGNNTNLTVGQELNINCY